MTLDQIVLWIIVVGIAGLLADALVKGYRVGLVGAIVVGILGGLIGGWLLRRLRISLGCGLIREILTSFEGAVILLIVLRVLRRMELRGRLRFHCRHGEVIGNVVGGGPSAIGGR